MVKKEVKQLAKFQPLFERLSLAQGALEEIQCVAEYDLSLDWPDSCDRERFRERIQEALDKLSDARREVFQILLFGEYASPKPEPPEEDRTGGKVGDTPPASV